MQNAMKLLKKAYIFQAWVPLVRPSMRPKHAYITISA